MDKVLIKQLLFHGSWLVVPAIAWLLWRWRDSRHRGLLALLLRGCGVFTTRGVGEIGLPLRLLNPPTIDLLQLQP